MIAPPPGTILNIGVHAQPPNALPPWIDSGNNTMELYPDFKELLELLAENKGRSRIERFLEKHKKTKKRENSRLPLPQPGPSLHIEP